MSEEIIESKLVALRNKKVVIVSPAFGSVSYSYSGELYSTVEGYPIKFHFTGQSGIAIIFYAKDVETVETRADFANLNIIRLKGPHDYQEDYQKTH